jgi:hypothetical protein
MIMYAQIEELTQSACMLALLTHLHAQGLQLAHAHLQVRQPPERQESLCRRTDISTIQALSLQVTQDALIAALLFH